MTITLNHTIIPAKDKTLSATFLAELLGVAVEPAAGPFIPVKINRDLTFDFDDRHEPSPGHYAFLVDDTTFDRILRHAKTRGLVFGSGPGAGWDGRENHLNGGRGVYIQDPNGHSYEFFTVPPGPA